MNARTSDLARIQQLLHAQAFEVERQPRRSAFLIMFAETGPLRRQLYANSDLWCAQAELPDGILRHRHARDIRRMKASGRRAPNRLSNQVAQFPSDSRPYM